MKESSKVTIEVQQTDLKKNQRLIKQIVKVLPPNTYFHFLFEPKLIIRVMSGNSGQIYRYLKSRNIKSTVYAYPFGKGYGQGKRGDVVYKYRDCFYLIMWMNSVLAVIRDKKDDKSIIERETHTLMNSFGYSWEKETLTYLKLAWGRMGCIRKYNNLSPFMYLYCSSIMGLIRFTYLITKGVDIKEDASKRPTTN